MAKWIFRRGIYPPLPDWTSGYAIVSIHDPNLSLAYLIAAKDYKITSSWNITYDYMFTTSPVDGVMSRLVLGDSGYEWSAPEPTDHYIWTNSPYIDGSNLPLWANTDIYCVLRNSNSGSDDYIKKNKYVALAGSEPVKIELGWTDYGSDGRIMDLTDRTLNVPQGLSVAGAFRCSVSGATESITFKWYDSGTLVRTQKSGTCSDYKPPANKTGHRWIWCEVIFSSGFSTSTDWMGWNVAVYDPGGGGSDGGTDDEVIGGGIILSSRVTDIVLTVSPDTVVPGGHSLIEVSVNGIGNYSQAFTAQIGGYASAATHMVTGGYTCNVWIAEDETADYVLVTVTSVQDPTITATTMIFIDQSATEDDGTEAEQLRRAFWAGFAAGVPN